MEFDQFTIVLLIRPDDAPQLPADEADALQDRHLSHLADLHEAGVLLAAGPLLGEPDRSLRGLSILNVAPDEARRLKEDDPAVKAGLFRLEIFPWMVPAGAAHFAPTHFPRSIADANG
jgi:uncharacterized protein YciI